jgi:hypothetical protein
MFVRFETGVQLVALTLPVGTLILTRSFPFGAACGGQELGLFHDLARSKFGLCLGGKLCFSVHGQQHENERTHRAQQDGQERKSRDFELATASHAAFPGCARGA